MLVCGLRPTVTAFALPALPLRSLAVLTFCPRNWILPSPQAVGARQAVAFRGVRLGLSLFGTTDPVLHCVYLYIRYHCYSDFDRCPVLYARLPTQAPHTHPSDG